MSLNVKKKISKWLNSIFRHDKPNHQCMNVDKDPADDFDKFVEYVKPILEDFNKRITALETNVENDSPLKESLDNNLAEDTKKLNKNNNRNLNISKTRTTSGIYRVSYNKQMKRWRYFNTSNGFDTYNTDLKVLKQNVEDAGQEWIIIDDELAEYSYNHNKPNPNQKSKSPTGISHVIYLPSNKEWRYYIINKNHRIQLGNRDLKVLEKRVKEKGYDWIITDNELAEQSYKKSEEYLKKNKRANIQKSEKEGYVFPNTYKKYITPILKNGMVVFKRTSLETTEFLKMFYCTKRELLMEDYHSLKKIQKNSSVSSYNFFTYIYGFSVDMKRGYGDYLKIVFEIFENDYEVPHYINFSMASNTVLINGKSTKIHKKQLKKFIGELEVSVHPKCDIVRIMHDNPKLNKKYLWYILNYYDRKELLEVLE